MTDKFRNKYRVASNRWQFWDYSAPEHYFITICVAGHQCILGNVLNKKNAIIRIRKNRRK